MISNSSWIPAGAVYYNQENTVAVLFDPEGGHHMCNDITDSRYDSEPLFWAAGYVGKSPEELANRICNNWLDESPEPEDTYLRQLSCYGEYE